MRMLSQSLEGFTNIAQKLGFARQERSLGARINYKEYYPAKGEVLRYYAASAAGLAFIALLFYRSFIITIPAMLLSVPLQKLYAKYKIEKRQASLLDSFRDALYSISSSVAAGRKMPFAIEEACASASGDMKEELLRISKDYKESHASIAIALKDLGQRSGVEEIQLFADSYEICEKCGADLEAVCLKSAALLLDRIAYGREVKALTAQKKLDMILLTAMPLAVLLLLNLIAYSYVEPLYSGPSGRLAMTLCLALIASALLWGMKIVSLKL